jgi:hypothetical protein
MSFKKFSPSAPVKNVVLGQVATHALDVGKNFKAIQYVLTVTKTAATGGFTSAALTDALGLVVVKVGTIAKRQATAAQIDAIQTRWHSNLAVKSYDGVANDLITAVADVVAGGNTTRTTTFIFTVYFAEPARDNFATRNLFAWPTLWASGRKVQISIELSVPANAGIANPVIRANENFDYTLGPVDSNNNDVMPVTHWYLDPQNYSSVNFSLRDWPYQGIVQQITIFSPAGSNDYVGTAQVVGDSDLKFSGAKAELDKLYNDYKFNAAGVLPGMADLVFDYTDDPSDALDMRQFKTFQLNLVLTAAAAGNKSLNIVSQVFKDALAA